MNRYASVYDVVNHVTDSPTLRVFYVLYLMATSDTERQALNDRFWLDVEQFEEEEREIIRAEMGNSLRRLPELVNQLHEKVNAVLQKPSPALNN